MPNHDIKDSEVYQDAIWNKEKKTIGGGNALQSQP